MDGKTRRDQIIKILSENGQPVSGSELAKLLGVSRQVIVVDIALLRADDRRILSTNKGYVITGGGGNEENRRMRVFCANHANEDTLDELCTIVDYGGRVLNVSIDHEIYGQICLDLIINNRFDAREFVNQMEKSKDLPLKALTGGCHYHAVAAETEKNLDMIELELKKKGYLI